MFIWSIRKYILSTNICLALNKALRIYIAVNKMFSNYCPVEVKFCQWSQILNKLVRIDRDMDVGRDIETERYRCQCDKWREIRQSTEMGASKRLEKFEGKKFMQKK